MNVLVIDIGGTSVKILATGQTEPRKFPSGPNDDAPADGGRSQGAGRGLEVRRGLDRLPRAGRRRPHRSPNRITSPRAGSGSTSRRRSGAPSRSSTMRPCRRSGSYEGGTMLFLGLGTGLGSALIVAGTSCRWNSGHLSYRNGTIEDYVGVRGLKKLGKKRWRKIVELLVARFTAALLLDDVVIGGGNAKKLKKLPPGCRLGDNANAFIGGFRLWETSEAARSVTRAQRPRHDRPKKAKGTTTHDGHRTASLTARPAWKALVAHHEKIRDVHLRKLFADDPSARRAHDGGGGGRLPRLLEEPHHRRNPRAARCSWPRNPACAQRIDAMFRGDKINITENRAVLHVALRAPRSGIHRRGRRERGAPGPRRAGQDGGVLRPRPERRMEGPHRQAHPQRRQHRHRRLRPRAR